MNHYSHACLISTHHIILHGDSSSLPLGPVKFLFYSFSNIPLGMNNKDLTQGPAIFSIAVYSIVCSGLLNTAQNRMGCFLPRCVCSHSLFGMLCTRVPLPTPAPALMYFYYRTFQLSFMTCACPLIAFY